MQSEADQTETAPKPPFEPSEIVDHGDASELTQGGTSGVSDGSQYS